MCNPSDRRIATALRGFGPYGLLAILVIALVPSPWLKAVAVLIWVQWSGTPWREVGYSRPANWTRTVTIGIALGITLKLGMKAIVMPFLGADPVNAAYHYLTGNPAALPAILFAATVSAGFGEETVFRGYLFERLGKLFGSGAGARTFIVLFTAGLFGLVHYPDQGLAGVEQAMVTGLVFGSIYAFTGRIWVPMIAHTAFNLTAVAMIYWDLETRVAHSIFQ